MPPAQSVLDAAPLVATAGAATALVVQMVKTWLDIDSPRARVATAVIVGVGLTMLFGVSNGLITLANAFTLAIASITIAATGAGVHSAVTAGATNKPTTPD